MIRFVLLTALFTFSSFLCGQTIRVLFVGNSLTYTNDLPTLVEKVAKVQDVKIKSDMLALPNYAIIDHWNDGEVQKYIKSERYDYVIIQQGPSSQDDGRRMLIDDGARFQKLCKQSKSKLVYFMVWPSRMHYTTFDKVIENHREAAAKNDAILCPVGEAWKTHFDNTNDYSLYGLDGFHPSYKGSRLAAELMVETILSNE